MNEIRQWSKLVQVEFFHFSRSTNANEGINDDHMYIGLMM